MGGSATLDRPCCCVSRAAWSIQGDAFVDVEMDGALLMRHLRRANRQNLGRHATNIDTTGSAHHARFDDGDRRALLCGSQCCGKDAEPLPMMTTFSAAPAPGTDVGGATENAAP